MHYIKLLLIALCLPLLCQARQTYHLKIDIEKGTSVSLDSASETSYDKPVIIDDYNNLIDLGDKVKIIIDHSNDINIESLIAGDHQDLYKTSSRKIFGSGIIPDPIWCKILLENKIDEKIYLEIGAPYIDSISVYVVQPDSSYSHVENGARFPFHSRDIKTNNFLFFLPLEQGEQKTFYLKITSHKPILLPLKVGSARAFLEKDHIKDFIHGCFYGFMMLMIFYNFMFFVTIRENIYLYYVLYVGSITMCMSNNDKYLFEFLWPDSPWLNSYTATFIGLTMLFALIFHLNFLNLRSYSQTLYRICIALLPVPFVILFLNLRNRDTEAFLFSHIIYGLVAVFFVISAFIIFQKGYRPAKFYAMAWGCIVLSFAVLIMNELNMVPYSALTNNSLQLGAIFEVMLLSLAVADKINLYKKEKEDAKDLALKSLQEKESLIREQSQVLEQEIIERTREISMKNDELNLQTEKMLIQAEDIFQKTQDLEDALNNINSSLQYAKRIQNAILGNVDYITSRFREAFILFYPRDIVSGDFYWFTEKGNLKIMVAGDCTGHGVPGAFMTVMGNDFLNDIIVNRDIVDPAAILTALDQMIIATIQKINSGNVPNRDGMDISILVFDEVEKTVSYSGAKNPLYMIRSNEIEVIKGSNYSIGTSIFYKAEAFLPKFKTVLIDLQEDDQFYIFTDGYQDQFGGESNRKFMSRKLRKLLLDISCMSMEEQKLMLDEVFNNWKGGLSQTDDVLLVGIKY